MGRKRVEIQLWWEVPLVELPEMEVQSYNLGERGKKMMIHAVRGAWEQGCLARYPKF